MVIVSEGVGDALATNVGHQNLDAAVVVWRVGEIPSFGGVVSPRAASVGFHVDENLHAEGSHGSCVEREGAFERFVGGEEGVLTTRAEHVEGGIALFCEAAPVRNWEGLWEAGNAHEEVIFPGAYRPFRRISAMLVRWSVLEARLLPLDEFFNLVRCLIVHFVQEGFEAPHRQTLAGFLVGAREFFLRSALNGDRANVVGVVDVEYNDVCVTSVGGDGEPACLVAGDDAVDGMDLHENVVGACIEWCLGGFFHVIVNVEAGHGGNGGTCGSSWLCGASALPNLVQVAHHQLR